MASKQPTSMASTLAEFKELKNIDKETLIAVLQDAFKSVLAKMFGSDENFTVIVSPETGDFEIWRNRTVVDGDINEPNLEVSLKDAQKIDPYAEIGDVVTDSIDFSSFGRRAILNLRQALAGRIMDLQKEALYNKFKGKIGQLVSAEVYQVWKREVLLIDDEGNEMLLPRHEQIPRDFFNKGDTVHCVVDRVDNENNTVKIFVSRTSPEFIKRLFELNVPEIGDGLITIKRVVRIPGERAKMAVESYDDRIDPVGTCVGMNGSRIRSIVRELKGENIDVIPYTTNPALLLQRALSPAKISNIKLIPEEMKAEITFPPEDVSLAIGKNASNIKLATALTGYDIQVFRDLDEVDIALDLFDDEIERWVIDTLKEIGCTTAKSVLRIPRERLEKRTDLEMSTINHVLDVLAEEFKPEELQDIGYKTLEEYLQEKQPVFNEEDLLDDEEGDEQPASEGTDEPNEKAEEANNEEL